MATLHRGESDYPLPEALRARARRRQRLPRRPDALATHVLDQGRIVPLTDDARRKFLDANERMANDGIRVLGVAFRRFDAPPAPQAKARDVESDLVFCGLIGMMDPPREAVRAAIAAATPPASAPS
jgi:P-type Ca2+ transporter type 2C